MSVGRSRRAVSGRTARASALLRRLDGGDVDHCWKVMSPWLRARVTAGAREKASAIRDAVFSFLTGGRASARAPIGKAAASRGVDPPGLGGFSVHL
jgi:hypothetical protein